MVAGQLLPAVAGPERAGKLPERPYQRQRQRGSKDSE